MDELLKAFQDLANKVESNTSVVKEFLEKQSEAQNEDNKFWMSLQELKDKNPIVKIAMYLVQRHEKNSWKDVWFDDRMFNNKQDADDYISTLKWRWRILIKVKYLSSNDSIDGEPKGENHGQSIDLQRVEELDETSDTIFQD